MEIGQVIEILPDNHIKIRMERSEACAKCGACTSFGKEMTIIAYNPDGARISEWVSISLESKYFLTAAFILYGLPLSALLIGATVGYYGAMQTPLRQFSPVAGLILGMVFTAASFLLIKVLDKRIKKTLYTPIAHIES